MIQVSDLHKSYGRIPAVRGVDFDVTRGETLGIIGPNGAGKSTILKILLGLVRPDRGNISVDGIDLARDPVRARRLMGYVPQKDGFEYGATGREALSFLARLRGAEPGTVGNYAAMVGVESLLDRRVGTLSGGQRQRLSLAAALLGDPPLLLLDEPTASLDPRATAEFRDLVEGLSASGRTLVLCSHLLTDVERLCHRVLILLEGRVAAIEDNRGLPSYLVVELEDLPWPERALDGFGEAVRSVGGGILQADLDAAGQIRLLNALTQAGARIRSFETRRPTLEERFLSRVGGRGNGDLTMTRAILALLVLVLAGCSSSSDNGPVIEAGKAACIECRMGVNDLSYACAVRTAANEDLFFDAVECLIRYQRRNRADGSEAWIADFDGKQLHPALEMTIVQAGFPSPMGGGYAAFRDRAKARDLAGARDGATGTLDEFIQGTASPGNTGR